jgi:hypothetical protein
MKALYGKLPQVEDLFKACASPKNIRTEWINRMPDGKTIAKQYSSEMKPVMAEAKCLLDELKKLDEGRKTHAASSGGGAAAAATSSGSGHPPPPTPPPISLSPALPLSAPASPAAVAAADSSSLPLLIEVTDAIYQVHDEPDTYWWPVVVKEGTLKPGANVRLKSIRDVLFIGSLRGPKITIRTLQRDSEFEKADMALPGVCACSRALFEHALVRVSHALLQATAACSK